jgi:glucosyl-dolichyl phosphate glucuronosyltransferase
VVVSTYNRAHVLRNTLHSLARQEGGDLSYEVIIVDNNSTDATRQVVEDFVAEGGGTTVRYVFEPKQGVSYGRNAGILAAKGSIIAFTDDDVAVAPNWVETIARLLEEHPDAACVGGRVFPQWDRPVPRWLTREHWGPLALLDYGESAFYVNASRRLCLITANVAFRREVFDRVGFFSPHVQTFKRVAATEDHELLLRLWRKGGQGFYAPELTAATAVVPERLTKTYHRTWHYRHGRFLALMRDDDFERSRVGQLFGVPAHVYRQAVAELGHFLFVLLRRGPDAAFVHETRLWSLLGFLQARWKEPSRPDAGAGC